MSNSTLHQANKAKNDEFYTQYCDIEKELKNYKDCFEGKVVYCNCDNHTKSNFWKYFVDNLRTLKIKKLIATYFDNEKSPVKAEMYYQGKMTYMTLTEMKGDGDFRGKESIEILKECDIVVTNPPFSLFRDFIKQIMKYNKQFLIIGNINCISYKAVFPLLQENKVWLGTGIGRWISGFIVPENYELYGTEAIVDESGNRIVSTNNALWLTNLDHKKRHKPLKLTKKYNENKYYKYTNCDGINVNKTQDIPCDYDGIMGVPITFMDKYCPEQFKIVGFRKGDNGKDLVYTNDEGKVIQPYFRILIKRR